MVILLKDDLKTVGCVLMVLHEDVLPDEMVVMYEPAGCKQPA